MEKNRESVSRLIRDIKKSPQKLLAKLDGELELTGMIRVDQANLLAEILFRDYDIPGQAFSLDQDSAVSEYFQKIEELLMSLKLEDSEVKKEKISKIDFKTTSFIDFVTRINLKSADLSDEIEASDLYSSFEGFLRDCKILVESSDLKTLKRKSKNSSFSKTLTKEQFVNILVDWYKTSNSNSDLRSKIMKTIGEFEEMINKNVSFDEKVSLDNLIHSLKIQLKKIPNKIDNSKDNISENGRKGLSEIFKHYSKQQFLLGKTPTFDKIQKNLEVLTLAKFLKFCKDFEIIMVNPTEREERSKSRWATNVFKTFSEFNREMYEHHFISSMVEIADHYLDKTYDKKNLTNWSELQKEQKVLKFYQIMGFHDPKIYTKKLKDISIHFGVNESSRIPENDLSKRYKFDLEKYNKQKHSIDEWKARKKEENRLLEEKKTERAKSKPNYQKSQNYSSKFPDPKLTRKDSGFAIPEEKPEAKPFTIQRLKDLQIEDLSKLDKEFDIADLIIDEEQYLNSVSSKLKLPALSSLKSDTALIHPTQRSSLSHIPNLYYNNSSKHL